MHEHNECTLHKVVPNCNACFSLVKFCADFFSIQLERYPEVEVTSAPLPVVHLTDEVESHAWWAGESQAVEEPDPNNLDDSLLCHEVLDSFPPIEDCLDHPNLNRDKNEVPATKANTLCVFSDLDNIIVDTPPDFQLAVRSATFILSIIFSF